MNMPNLFSQTAIHPPSRFFIALYLNHRKVQAALWRVVESSIEVTARSQIHFFSDNDECLVEIDEALQELGAESEGVSEVVFGFNADWLEKGEVADKKKPLLKKVCKELALKPVGFVVTSEALAQYLSREEPLFSASLVEVKETELMVALLQRGSISYRVEVGRSDDVVADINEALARIEKKLGQENLPPKILIFSLTHGQEELKEIQQSLLSFDWTKDHPFLYPPVVDVQSGTLVIDAIAHQGGQAVAESMGLLPSSTLTSTPTSTERFNNKGSDQTNKKQAIQKNNALDGELAISLDATTSSNQAQEFGFEEIEPQQGETQMSQNKQLDKKEAASSKVAPRQETQETAVAESESNVQSVQTAPPQVLTEKYGDAYPELGIDEDPVADDKKENFLHKTMSGLIATEKELSHKPFVLVGFVGGLLILAVLAIFFLLTAKTATIAIELKTTPISESTELLLDPDMTDVETDQPVLQAQVSTQPIEGSRTVETTGIKLIGEKAAGKIDLVNKTDSTKTFEEGTILKYDDLEFVLDEEVKVASASVTTDIDGEKKVYGKESTTVTAQQIGADSNLAQGERLTVASYDTSSYEAEVMEGLNGGASREIRVVAANDITTITADLTQELTQQAQQQIEEQSKDGVYFVPTGKVTTLSSTLDAEEGEEVETLTLDLSLEVEAFSYNVADLKPLAQSILSQKVSQGFSLSENDPQILSAPSDTATASGQVALSVQISSRAVPIVSVDQWKQEIAGQKIESAQSILKSKSEIKEAKISINPSIAGRIFPTIPKVLSKIVFTIK